MDLFILKTDVEKFTSTNEKTLHLIFNAVNAEKYAIVLKVCITANWKKQVGLKTRSRYISRI